MKFDPILLPSRRARMVAEGFWADRTVNDYLDRCVELCPERVALTAARAATGTTRRFSYRELRRTADRVAIGLTRLGIGKHDVVACQLPNWWELTVTYLACARIGAVFNALMPIFRERELGFMLRHAEARVLVIPKSYRNFEYEPMARALQASLPHLRNIVVVDGAHDGVAAPHSFEALLSGPAWEEQPDAASLLTRDRPAPDDVMQLVYTSGTTGEPKCVMNSANTAFGSIANYAERLGLNGDDVVLMASPMAHQTGFLYGLNLPILLGATAVLQDIWEPRRAVELIRSEGVTYTTGSTPFLNDLADAVATTGLRVPTLRVFLCGGAPIPGPLVEKALQIIGCKVVSAWGMSEMGTATITRVDDPDERAVNTDGCPLPGNELKVVDSEGLALPAGQVGNLMIRSSSLMGGYLKRPELNSVDADGWFDSGDMASIDERGYIRITGRSKDVVIRGGEKIPVFEIESLLFRHPAVAMVAVVAYPDERLGERACAIVSLKPGTRIDFAAMTQFLKAEKLTNQYIPERLVVLDELPCTPTGKVQKHKLREMLRAGLPDAPP